MADAAPATSHTLLQNVLDPTLPNLAIFDMKFKTFMFWLRGGGNYRQESHDLAAFLIRRWVHMVKLSIPSAMSTRRVVVFNPADYEQGMHAVHVHLFCAHVGRFLQSFSTCLHSC